MGKNGNFINLKLNQQQRVQKVKGFNFTTWFDEHFGKVYPSLKNIDGYVVPFQTKLHSHYMLCLSIKCKHSCCSLWEKCWV